MNIQLIKKKQGRRRFLKTAPLFSIQGWLAEEARMKAWIVSESQFQLVGHTTYLEILDSQISLMLEVVGVPRNLDQIEWSLLDLEAADALIYQFKNDDLFTVDLESVLASAEKIKTALGSGENKLTLAFHLVIEKEKIALHFFRQKDYSQNLL
jgi:membrane protein required for beta-lactamase induction